MIGSPDDQDKKEEDEEVEVPDERVITVVDLSNIGSQDSKHAENVSQTYDSFN